MGWRGQQNHRILPQLNHEDEFTFLGTCARYETNHNVKWKQHFPTSEHEKNNAVSD